VDQGNVEEELLHDQYVRFPDQEDTSERRDTLGSISHAAFEAIDTGSTPLSALATALAPPSRGRHIMVWSNRPAEEAGWQALGVGGRLGADSLLVSVLNRGGNKLDHFLRVDADLALAPSGRGTAGTLTLHLANTVPDGEPPDVAGPYRAKDGSTSGVGKNVYLGIVSVDLPGTAHQSRFDGVDELGVAGADGACRVVGFQMQLAQGESRTYVLHFLLPGGHGTLRVEPSARVPAIRWRTKGMTWTDGASQMVAW
jgi:hypothetical protein